MPPFMCLTTIIIVITLQVFADDQSKCWDDWMMWNQNCYKYVVHASGTVTWDSAEGNCADMDSHLASIHSTEEEQFIWNTVIANPQCTKDCAWIGLSLNVPENANCGWRFNQCRWSDGSLFDYANWMPGEPNNATQFGAENCVIIDSTFSGKWNDLKCSGGLTRNGGWICKRPAEQQTKSKNTAALAVSLSIITVVVIILLAFCVYKNRSKFNALRQHRSFGMFRLTEDEAANLPSNMG